MGTDLFEEMCIKLNNSQTEVGSPLRTLKGSLIQRSTRYGIGKMMGRKLYFHRMYVNEIITDPNALALFNIADEAINFNYNIIRWDVYNCQIALEESPDFDSAREPIVGRVFVVESDGSKRETRPYSHILHHKWTMVKNDYTGFNVKESWEWSRTWLNKLLKAANGTSMKLWSDQLSSVNLS